MPAGGEWLNLWSDTEAVYKAGVVTLFMKGIFDLSSLDPQQCLSKLIPDALGSGPEAPAMGDNQASTEKEENRSPKKVRINRPFNPDLLPVRPNRSKNSAIKKVKGYGPSPNQDKVKVGANCAGLLPLGQHSEVVYCTAAGKHH